MISVRRRALGHPWAFAGDADTRDIAWKGVGLMIRIENHLGTIEISQEYFSYLIGSAASSLPFPETDPGDSEKIRGILKKAGLL